MIEEIQRQQYTCKRGTVLNSVHSYAWDLGYYTADTLLTGFYLTRWLNQCCSPPQWNTQLASPGCLLWRLDFLTRGLYTCTLLIISLSRIEVFVPKLMLDTFVIPYSVNDEILLWKGDLLLLKICWMLWETKVRKMVSFRNSLSN